MKRRGGGHSIRESMIKCILCYVLAPLFLALGILCYLVRQFTVRFFTCQKRAKQLLTEGKMVYQVSDILGYENSTYFSKVFKKIEGITPEQYWKKLPS